MTKLHLNNMFRLAYFEHLGQYHFPLGTTLSLTHSKWNHSLHFLFSHKIILPYSGLRHKQYNKTFSFHGSTLFQLVLVFQLFF